MRHAEEREAVGVTFRHATLLAGAVFAGLLCAACQTREASDATPIAKGRPPSAATAPAEFRLPDDFFPIMPWELPPRSLKFADPEHGLKSLADSGFTTAAFVPARLVPECKRKNESSTTGAVRPALPCTLLEDMPSEDELRSSAPLPSSHSRTNRAGCEANLAFLALEWKFIRLFFAGSAAADQFGSVNELSQ